MKRLLLLSILTLFGSTNAIAAGLPPATILEYNAYDDAGGRVIFKTDMPDNQYQGADCPLGWFQLEGDAPDRLFSSLIAAFQAGNQVSLTIDDNTCSTGSWPKIRSAKIHR